ncbi:MAG: hypothetical protein R3F62_22070 [Planctomycetota bacterium]
MDYDDPYAVGADADGLRSQPAYYPPGITPPVILWMRIYNGLLAAVYFLVLLMGLAFLVFREEFGRQPGNSPEDALIAGFLYAGMGAVLCPLYAVGVWLPRKGWAWVYAIVLLALSMTSCCCLVFAIPLLIYWIKPECKAWFQV